MARKKAPAFERLLSIARKAGSLKRQTHQLRAKRAVVIKPTTAERLAKRQKLRERKVSYKAAIAEAHQKIQQLALEIHAKFKNFSQDRVVTDVFQSRRLKDSSKKVSRYAAFVSAQMKILNAETPEGQPRQKVNELSKRIADQWGKMTEEEKVAATEEGLTALCERREVQDTGTWHNADLSASHDTSLTVGRVKEELQRLNARTGDESVLFVTRGSLTRFHPAESYCSSDRAEGFLSTVLKTSGEDIALRMDAYMVLGVEGVARNHAKALLESKARVAALILQKLKQCAGNQDAKKMFYTNFEDHITRPYGIVIKNWPLKKFKNPSSIHSQADLSVLWNTFETGATHFYKMNKGEYQEWETKEVDARRKAEEALQALRDMRAEERSPLEPNDAAERPLPQRNQSPTAPVLPTSINVAPSEPSTPNFFTATVVTNAAGEAVVSTSRPRKRRSDAGIPRKKKAKKNAQAASEDRDA
ncbi:hypothetical protein BT96DRAFT_987981 [Gymnopus androsaceus JB14]|uniref:Uncharacterized protein n=1 Tax=Gymnopus androsaceus JB14 TaxID=1447944 RepID=A0A6A4I5L9_9AGAR|nr:hypothetical protein BT96DRAFT_987981 [Gymnopus androsaceus JB14]